MKYQEFEKLILQLTIDRNPIDIYYGIFHCSADFFETYMAGNKCPEKMNYLAEFAIRKVLVRYGIFMDPYFGKQTVDNRQLKSAPFSLELQYTISSKNHKLLNEIDDFPTYIYFTNTKQEPEKITIRSIKYDASRMKPNWTTWNLDASTSTVIDFTNIIEEIINKYFNLNIF